MDFTNIIKHTLAAGANKAKIIRTTSLEFDRNYVKYCEDNRCGQYGRNYSCPPLCGTPEELITKACEYEYALVISSISLVTDPSDELEIANAKHENDIICEKMRRYMIAHRLPYMMARANYCNYCKVCAATRNKPCMHPDIASISLSAFCINLTSLAGTCDMTFDHGEGTITLFSIIFFQSTPGWNPNL